MIVATRPIKKNLPFAHLHYISDLNIFLECIEKIRMIVCLRLKVVALLVDKRYLREKKVPQSWEYPLLRPRMYKSGHLKKDDITTLYSELIFLNL